MIFTLGSFRCYYDPVIGHYYTDIPCNVPAGLSDLEKVSLILTPTLVNNHVTVEGQMNNGDLVRVLNVYGQIQHSELVSHLESISLSTSKFLPGIYIVALERNGKTIAANRFTKF